MFCFIAEQNSKRLYGTWRPLGPAAMDIDRVAFAGRQPAQLRVELKRELGWRSGTEKPNESDGIEESFYIFDAAKKEATLKVEPKRETTVKTEPGSASNKPPSKWLLA